MTEYFIFSDASYDPKTKKGIAAFLITSDTLNIKNPNSKIETIAIDGENIARLEFHSAIAALNTWKRKFQNKEKFKIQLIIDCKAVENILVRRQKLEKSNYLSKSKGEILSNADLYKQFFQLYDELNPEIIWVRGHSPRSDQSELEAVFSIVDKQARHALRHEISLFPKTML